MRAGGGGICCSAGSVIQRCFTPPIVIREPSLAVRSSLPFVVAHELLRNPRMTFLQIGAFDGVGEDDLRELVMTHKLRGVLVEPQPAAFARLQQTYRNQPQVTLLQAAIAEQEGTRDLYLPSRRRLDGGVVRSEHLRKHGIPDRDIVAQPVPCHTVESALRPAGLDASRSDSDRCRRLRLADHSVDRFRAIAAADFAV